MPKNIAQLKRDQEYRYHLISIMYVCSDEKNGVILLLFIKDRIIFYFFFVLAYIYSFFIFKLNYFFKVICYIILYNINETLSLLFIYFLLFNTIHH